MSTVHVCSPLLLERKMGRAHCPTCERPTFFLMWYYEWYGGSSVCLRCGDRWNDGEMEERPFERAWRKKSIASAKKRWRMNR